MAAYGTTAGILAWGVAELARRPEIQDHLFTTLTTFLAAPLAPSAPSLLESTAPSRQSQMANKKTMMNQPLGTTTAPADATIVTPRGVTRAQIKDDYTVAVVDEILRLHHIAPFIGRWIQHPFTYLRPVLRSPLDNQANRDISDEQPLYEIPAGALAVALPGATQQQTSYFSHPTQFDPDRFFLRHEDRTPPSALYSFGGGLHRCLGSVFAHAEIAATLCYLVQAASFTFSPGARWPSAGYIPSNQPTGSVAITYHHRHNTRIQHQTDGAS